MRNLIFLVLLWFFLIFLVVGDDLPDLSGPKNKTVGVIGSIIMGLLIFYLIPKNWARSNKVFMVLYWSYFIWVVVAAGEWVDPKTWEVIGSIIMGLLIFLGILRLINTGLKQ